jgi:hypothetical protein
MKTKDHCGNSGNIPGMFMKTKVVISTKRECIGKKAVNVELTPAVPAI